MLAGTLDISSLPVSDEVVSCLKELAYDNYTPPDPIHLWITEEDFKESVKQCNANVSASPSGFGYVVWKACGLSAMACRVHITMVYFPFVHGFAPSRWKQCLEVMLEKDPGNPAIHRL